MLVVSKAISVAGHKARPLILFSRQTRSVLTRMKFLQHIRNLSGMCSITASMAITSSGGLPREI